MNFLNKQRGVAAVELGILLIPMILLSFGITEYGRAIYQYNAITKSTRDAVPVIKRTGDPADITAAKCLVVHGNKGCTGNPLVPDLTTAMVTICDSTNCADHKDQGTGSGVINLVTVTATGYPLPRWFPLLHPTSSSAPSAQRCARYYEIHISDITRIPLPPARHRCS